MSLNVLDHLQRLNLSLPEPAAPAANYVPFLNVNGWVYISGQLPILKGQVAFRGRVGETLSLEDGQKAAQLCALNVVSQLNVACDGDFDRVQRCVRLTGFVCCAADFEDHSQVINGASDLIGTLFGTQGQHTRVAVGVQSLPLGAAVEVEGLFTIA